MTEKDLKELIGHIVLQMREVELKATTDIQNLQAELSERDGRIAVMKKKGGKVS